MARHEFVFDDPTRSPYCKNCGVGHLVGQRMDKCQGKYQADRIAALEVEIEYYRDKCEKLHGFIADLKDALADTKDELSNMRKTIAGLQGSVKLK